MTSTFNPTAGPFSPTSLGPLAPEKKPAAKKPQPERGAPFKPTVETPAPPLEKPDPVLQQHGFNGGINQFNQRVQKAVDSYQQQYGVRIPPNLAFDVALSKVPDNDFERMFQVPIHPSAAKARGLVVKAGGTPQAGPDYKPLTHEDVAKGLIDAAAHGQYQDYLETHAAVIQDWQHDPATASRINGAISQGKLIQQHFEQVGHIGSAPSEIPADYGNPNNLVSPSDFDTLTKDAAGFRGIVSPITKSVAQITDALVHSPAGLARVGIAAGLDTNDALHGDLAFSRTRKIGKAVGEGYKSDIEHPGDNPGYLFLDALGLASAGAGTAARVGAAGKAAGELGEEASAAAKVGTAAKTLAKKPPLERATVTHGGYSEQMPLSQNPLVAAAQKGILKIRQRGVGRVTSKDPFGTGAQGPLQSILVPDALQGALEQHLSIPKKLGRLADSRKRIEYTAQTTLQRELDAVAGRTVFQSRALGKLPARVRGGLTRGEQRAIFALATDDLDPLTTAEDFHRSMIEQGIGDADAHRTQIADIKLARKAMQNPSPRFLKALELTRQVVAEQERIKMADLGLLPETAEGRVAKLGAFYRTGADGEVSSAGRTPAAIQGEINKLQGLLSAKHADESARSRVAPYSEGGVSKKIARLQTELAEAKQTLVPAERISDDSFYLPIQRRGKVKPLPSARQGFYATKAGPYGVPLGRPLPELTHEFTGKAILAGDYRIDATHLASESYGRTVRAATIRAEHAKLWDAGTDTPQSDFDIPIRDSNTIDDKLRKVVARLDEGDFTDADAKILPEDMRELIRELYPDKSIVERATEPIDGARWIDSRLLGESNLPPQIPGLQAKVGDMINEPFRFVSLYARPAYILNKLGNQAMLVYDQGVVSTARNMIRAMAGDRLYGEENMRTIRELVGAGHAQNLVTSKTSRVGQSVAHFWNRVADRDERVAAFLHYADRKGYVSKDDITRLLNDKDSRADLVEVTQRANKSLVEFDNLLPFEKNVLRHWVFVYPWVSRSAVWSIRTILDHPLKTDLLAHLGKEDIQDDPLAGRVVEWVKEIGYVPLGMNHDGTVKVVNPSSVNTFSTLGDFLAVTRAATEGDKYASAEDFLGPLPKYLLHAISGRDEYGNQYPGSQWWDAAKEVFQGLPQVTAYQRAGNAKRGGKAANVGSRESIVSSFNQALKQTVLTPGWLDGYGSLLAGGLSPRGINMDAAASRYWNDQNPTVKHSRELDLLNRALDMQASALEKPVPAAVRTAVRDQSNLAFNAQQFQKTHGRAPTDKERAQMALGYLVKQGVIPQGQQTQLAKTLASLVDPHDIATWKTALLTKYAHGGQLRQWDTDIRTVASFTPDVFNAKVSKLFAQGLAPQRRYQVGQEKLYDYGRRYVEFTHQVKQIQRQIQEGTKTAADLRAFEDAHDTPVDGLPSFVRIAWTHQTDQEQQQHIRSIATAGWSDLTSFDKQLLGVKSDAKVTAGWAELKQVIAEQRTKLERQGETFPKGYDRILARWVQNTLGFQGLLKDFDFSKEPLYRRLQVMKPVRDSPNSTRWTQLLGVANDYEKYLKSDSYNKTQVLQNWRDYIASDAFQQWLDEDPAFRQEIAGYGKGFLGRLLG